MKPTNGRRTPTARRVAPRPAPTLRFSPTAWAKLQCFCHRDHVEVGGFGVTPADDVLLVEDFVTVEQDVALASIAFDDAAVADFFEAQVDAGRRPEQFARIWVHTHPGDSPIPSRTDEDTFERVFGACDWAVMFVLARSGATYARLRFNAGPGGDVAVPVEVDYAGAFGASDHEAWAAEYDAHIHSAWPLEVGEALEDLEADVVEHRVPDDWLEDLEDMDPAERELVLDELAGRHEPWFEAMEAAYDDSEC